MERLVGLALSRYLATYIKNFSASQFKNWTLHNLEFKEDVVQSLAGIPNNFELKKVTCNQIYAKIPSLSMLGSDPIVLVADTIYIELEEPEIIKASKPNPIPAPTPDAMANTKKQSQGFMDRIIDNIEFELKELRIKVKLRGKNPKSDPPPTFDLIVQDIQIKSTNSKWKVVDLREVHRVDKNGHVIMYKEVDIGRFTFSVQPGQNAPIQVLGQIPIRVRTKTKKAYFRGPTINHAIQVDILDELLLHLHQKQFKSLQDAVDALLECMGRTAAPQDPSANEASTITTTAQLQNQNVPQQQQQTQNATSSQTPSLWGRFASVLGSYAGYSSSTETTTDQDTSQANSNQNNLQSSSQTVPPEGNSDLPTESSSSIVDDEDDEEYLDAESEVSSAIDLTDNTSSAVPDEEDITHTSYVIGLMKGKISLYDYILEEKGIAVLEFTNLRCSFTPSVKAPRPKLLLDQSLIEDGTITPEKEAELVDQTKIRITIESYSMHQLDVSPTTHKDFTYLLLRLEDEEEVPGKKDMPTLTLDFVKFADWKHPERLRREASLSIDRVAVIADMRRWERIWVFFFGGSKGEKFAQYMQENLGQMLEAALSEQVHFALNLRQPTFFLPPYGGKFPGKPHLASKVLKLHANEFQLKSLPIEAPVSPQFSTGVFVTQEFPCDPNVDFYDADLRNKDDSSNEIESSRNAVQPYKYPKRYDERDPLVMTERKFECSMTGMWIELQADPSSVPERVLHPFDMNAQMIRREFETRRSPTDPIHLPKWTPQIEGIISMSDIVVAFSPSQYTYFIGFWGERLSWNPNQITDEMKEAMKMEKILEAAEAGATNFTTTTINVQPTEEPPLLMRIRVFVPKLKVNLLERPEKLQGPKSNRNKNSSPTSNGTQSPATRDGTDTPPVIPMQDGLLSGSFNSISANSTDPASTPHAHLDHVILSEMVFDELAYILESHSDRSITKVMSPSFTVSSPVHIDSPFSSLVSPLEVKNSDILKAFGGKQPPNLLVRMERLKPDPSATTLTSEPAQEPQQTQVLDISPTMDVQLAGVQICWIYTTLAEVQVFFTRGDEVPIEMRGLANNPYFLPKQDSETNANNSSTSEEAKLEPPQTKGMDWTVRMIETELVVVETPDTPECAPMKLFDAKLDREGISLDEVHFGFVGKCAFYSEMWQQESDEFIRSELTLPFNMEVAYVNSRNTVTNNWSTNLEMLIDDLEVTVNRKQLIMMQNILDNQMADIRDVSSKRTAEKEKEKELEKGLSSSINELKPASRPGTPTNIVAPPKPLIKMTLPNTGNSSRNASPSKTRLKKPLSLSGTVEPPPKPLFSYSVTSEDELFNPRASTESARSSNENSTASSKQNRKPQVEYISDLLVKALRNRFQIGVQRMKMNLLDTNHQSFATINMSDFLYSTENWSDVWVMLIEGGDLTITSTKEQKLNSPYATILQPRILTDTEQHMIKPVVSPIIESIIPKISEETGPGLPQVLQQKFQKTLSQSLATPSGMGRKGSQSLKDPTQPNSHELEMIAELEKSPAKLDDISGSLGSNSLLDSFIILPSSVGSAPGTLSQPAKFRFGEVDGSPPMGQLDVIELPPRSFQRMKRKSKHQRNLMESESSDNFVQLQEDFDTFQTPKKSLSSKRNAYFTNSPHPRKRDFSLDVTQNLRTPSILRSRYNDLANGIEEDYSQAKSEKSKNLKKRSSMHSNPSSRPSSFKRSNDFSESSDSDSESMNALEDRLENEPVMLHNGRKFSLKFENQQPDFIGERENVRAKWASRWTIGFAPFDIAYNPEISAQLQDFFALMAEHKNLRHRYQNFQTEVLRVYREQGGILDQEAIQKIQQSQAQGLPQQQLNDQQRVALNIQISSPRVSIPQPLPEESEAHGKPLLSVLEVSLDNIRVFNAADAGPQNDNLSQTKIFVTGTRVMMKTIEITQNEPSSSQEPQDELNAFHQSSSSDPQPSSSNDQDVTVPSKNPTISTLILQSQELVQPVNVQISIEMKPTGADGNPFMHVSCDIDLFAAMISIKRYQLIVGLVNNYILSFFKRVRVNPDEDVTGGLGDPLYNQFISGNKPNPDESNPSTLDSRAVSNDQVMVVNKVVEINIKNVNLTVISDYMAELELVYLHFTDLNASIGMYDTVTDFTLGGRLEILINNLNYMIPERFVDELNFVVHLKSQKDTKKKESAPSEPASMKSSRASLQKSSNSIQKSLLLSPPSMRGHRRNLSSSSFDPESVIVELDSESASDDLSLDEDEDEDSLRSKIKHEEIDTVAFLDIAILDQIKFTLTNELVRHLLELYNLYTMVQQESSDKKSLLHFQYLLANRTESAIRYWQTNTDDVRVLMPGEETYFTFSNPYQLKRLEIEVEGWDRVEQAFSPEEVGSICMKMQQTVGEITNKRDVLVAVQPKGLKRYVEFMVTHHVVNDTDKILIVRALNKTPSRYTDSTTEYIIAPHTTVPIACSEAWTVEFSVSFGDGNWEFSRMFSLSATKTGSTTDTLRMFSQDSSDERWLLCTQTRENYPNLEGVFMVTLHFAAPVVIDNLCVFPLEYYFPSMLPRRPRPIPVQRVGKGIILKDDEDQIADSIAAVLPANSTSYFYFDTFRHRELCCRLVGYSHWSGRIQIERVQQSSLELYKTVEECMEGEKDDILLTLFIYARHNDIARRIAFNTQFLLVNDTDMLLFVRQQNTIPTTHLAPRQMKPFSWVRGSSKTLSVNMGNTAWSPPINITTDSYQRIEIKVPNLDVSYMFLMESHTLDDYSRVVCWRAWLHIRNHTSYDLKLNFTQANQNDSNIVELEDDRSSLSDGDSPHLHRRYEADTSSLLLGGDDDPYDFSSSKGTKRVGNARHLSLSDSDFEASRFDEENVIGDQTNILNSSIRNDVSGEAIVSDEGWIIVPRRSTTTSGLCPDILRLSIAKDYSNESSTASTINQQISSFIQEQIWSCVDIPTTQTKTFSVPITNLKDPKTFRAIDVAVTTDEKGLYITITDNKDPPYIVTNDTPFTIKLRRELKDNAFLNNTGSSSVPNSAFERRSSNNKNNAGPIRRSISSLLSSPSGPNKSPRRLIEDFVLEPNESINLFVGMNNDEEYEYKASVCLPESNETLKHNRRSSGGNVAGLGIMANTANQPHARSSSNPSNLAGSILNPLSSSSIISKPLLEEDDEMVSALDVSDGSDDEAEDFEDANDETNQNRTPSTKSSKISKSKLAREKRAKKNQGDESEEIAQRNQTMTTSLSLSDSQVASTSQSSGSPHSSTNALSPSLSDFHVPKRGHARNLSNGGLALSPRFTFDPRQQEPSIHIHPTTSQTYQKSSILEGQNPEQHSKLSKQFKKYFDASAPLWSAPFSLKSALEFEIEFYSSKDDFHSPQASVLLEEEAPPTLQDHFLMSETTAPNILQASCQLQGKTKVVRLTLPNIENGQEDSEEGEAAVRCVMKVDLLIPAFQVLMLGSVMREPIALVQLQKAQLEFSQYSNMQHSIYFVIQDAEANTLSPFAEYPVLFGLDKRALHGAKPRILEFLVEWNVRKERTFIEYIGLRILPFVFQIDSEIIDCVQPLQDLLATLTGSSASESEDEEHIRGSNVEMNEHANGFNDQMIASSSTTTSAHSSMRYKPQISQIGSVGRLGLSASGKFGGGYLYSGAADIELTDNNPSAPRNKRKLLKLLSLYTNIQADQFVFEKQIAQENYLYVGNLEIFPLRVTLSIGSNSMRWPVIAEAQLNLAAFSRNDLSESIGALFSTLGAAYSTLVWAEVYQIIGNLDAIASPLQNLRKLTSGVSDFLKLPLEGLVLDDTPGAYLVGLWHGSISLVLNFTDFFLTVMMKGFGSLAWVVQVMSLDEDYQKTKTLISRQHPTNAIYGIGQGVREFGRGIYEGVSGIVTLPVRGTRRHGALGFFSGVGKAVIGLPLKPVGGVFDLLSKTFEGLLQSLGRGYLLQERSAALAIVKQQQPEAEIREQLEAFIAQRDQKCLIIDDARFMRHGRPLERYLILTSHALYIMNMAKLHFEDYSPKKIPIAMIQDLLVPITPETQMVVRLRPSQVLWGQTQFLFIVPDRKHFIIKMAARFGIKSLEISKLERTRT